MAEELSGCVFETLREGRELDLYRGRSPARDSPAFLLVVPGPGPQARSYVSRLEHEYALKDALRPGWALEPLALARYQNRTALMLADPGGNPLDRLLDGRPLALPRFLQVATATARALHQAHRRGLVHKDIKPANVFVSDSGPVYLTGFGIASRLPRERQLPLVPEMIAGTLAYMAPEQSGRMNRSVDARSDLYSLGVTFYEMLVGQGPFIATEPMEWVHCHLARRPVPPSERVPAIPGAIDGIVLKLLCKNAEDRYQTAAGLEVDLRKCLALLADRQRFDSFPLGERDLSEQLRIPEKLYGRQTEIDTLVAAFERVATRGSTELVLVSGYSGVGKSSLVGELHKVLVPPRCLFAAGKFDQYKRDIPYATLSQAFQSLTRQLLGKSEVELERWRARLLEALGANGQLMVNLIPELAHVIGEQPPILELAPPDAQRRFNLVFGRFLDVFARPEHPLALFLDDLQWLDTATLELLERLVTDPEARSLLLIGAYRDNEVTDKHPLARTLGVLRRETAKVREIELGPLGQADLAELLADALHVGTSPVSALADSVFEKTGGNPFFVRQFVGALAEEGLLAFDVDTARWRWDMTLIRNKGITDNVAEFMTAKLGRLSTSTQEVLGLLACLGDIADPATLRLAHGGSEEQLAVNLLEAERAGFVQHGERSYAFLHDRVREAAYGLIPVQDRGAAHLAIGRGLAARASSGDLEENIFEIVNQLNRGASLIESSDERQRVAQLNLIAGKRAKTSTAYTSAVAYFAAGRGLLDGAGWNGTYRLSFDLELQLAECEFLTGEHAAALARLAALSQRAESLVDRASIARLCVALHMALGSVDRAIEVGLDYLRLDGTDWPRHPTGQNVQDELTQMGQLLAGRTIAQLIDLPLMSDPQRLATMDVLQELMPPTQFSDTNLHHLVLLRIANLSIRWGNCDVSCNAYAWLNIVLGLRLGDYASGLRFGQLGCELVDRRGLQRYKALVYVGFGGHVIPWTRHLRHGTEVLRRAHHAANTVGDVAYTAYSSYALTSNLQVSGQPLADVQREAEAALARARSARFGIAIDVFSVKLLSLHELRGVAFHDDSTFEAHLSAQPQLVFLRCFYWIDKMQLNFLAHDYVAALEATEKAKVLVPFARPYVESASYHFYAALIQAAVCSSAAPGARAQHMAAVLHHQAEIETWAESCADNFEHCAALVAAEVARIEGRELDAERRYEEAITSARKHGFVQNEGLANELAGRFHAGRGFPNIANFYLASARRCYVRWGAEGKVRQLDAGHPELRDPWTPAPTASFRAPLRELDLDTMFKAGQALSGEILLDKLIETLMRITVEHAAAERGVLLLLRNSEPQVAATAVVRRGQIEVSTGSRGVSCSDLPESALRYVIRTRQSMILDDASDDGVLSSDGYVREHHPKSVLCIPVIKQAKLVGALYLENNLTPGAFTPHRISVLEFLAAQAAISLENAYLYADLQRSESFLAEGQRMTQTGSWNWNLSTGKLVWSDEQYRVFGCDRRQVPVPTVELFLSRIHRDDRGFVEREFEAARRARKGFALDYRIVTSTGAVKYLHDVGHPRLTASSEIEDYFGTVADVTTRKRHEDELRDAQADLARAARLATVGELTASLAHEINQPLTAIVTSAESCLLWLTRESPNLPKARDSVERIVRDGRHVGEVIQSVRSMARKSSHEMTEIDVRDLVRGVLDLLAGELRRHDIWLEADLSNDLDTITGDRIQLQQVIVNLVMNGIEAMSSVTHRARTLRVCAEQDDKGQVQVSVADSGTGLESAHLSRIFEPWFTTKRDGMGLGLSICRSIVEAHGGQLWATPQLPHGTVFRFSVPVATDTLE